MNHLGQRSFASATTGRTYGRQNEEGVILGLHPTVKPVALVADAILDCSSRGDLVLDTFLGSGTTLIATERTGRTCYGLELDALYRHDHPPMAGLCGRDRAACYGRAQFCRARRGTRRAGVTKPCYDVGYGKPPLHTQFCKGQSGNPKGRGKGTRNFATIFSEAMTKPVIIKENGKRKKIPKLAAAATQLANDAARGDKKSIQLAFALLQALAPMIEAHRSHEEGPIETKVVHIYSGVLADGDRNV